jgi:hypothetical protein
MSPFPHINIKLGRAEDWMGRANQMRRHMPAHTQAASAQWPNHLGGPQVRALSFAPFNKAILLDKTPSPNSFYKASRPPHPLRYIFALLINHSYNVFILWNSFPAPGVHPNFRHCIQRWRNIWNTPNKGNKTNTNFLKPRLDLKHSSHFIYRSALVLPLPRYYQEFI